MRGKKENFREQCEGVLLLAMRKQRKVIRLIFAKAAFRALWDKM